MKIEEQKIRETCTVFRVGSRQFIAEYKADIGEWWLSEALWQSHKSGRPIQRLPHKRRPRYKRLEMCQSLEECREQVTLLLRASA